MKVTLKIFSLISIFLIISIFLYGVYSFQRDLNHFISDMKNDEMILAKLMSVEIVNLWNKEGEASVFNFIDIAKSSTDLIQFRWVWLDNQTRGSHIPLIENNTILENTKLNTKDFVNFIQENKLISYMLIKTPENRLGALELCEDLTPLINTFSRNNILHLGIAGFLILFFELITIWIMGHILLSNRINEILKSIKEIGTGNLSNPLVIKGNDEISLISKGLDKMRVNLKIAQDQLLETKNDKINLLQQLRHTDRLALIGRISSGITHELGTPLNIISGRAQLMQNGELSQDEISKNSRIIYEQANRITGIIQEFLKFARRKRIEKEYANLNSIIKNIVELMKPEAKKQNTIIAFDEYESDIELYLDKIQIQQVFSNIILNAIQAITIEEGKIEIGIKFHTMHNPNIESSARKKYVLIDIKDNGSGIPDEYLKHIFEPYFSTKDEGKGTGLGLSISDDIVKEHKGWIKVKNNKDRGCCFTIYLPCNGEE